MLIITQRFYSNCVLWKQCVQNSSTDQINPKLFWRKPMKGLFSCNRILVSAFPCDTVFLKTDSMNVKFPGGVGAFLNYDCTFRGQMWYGWVLSFYWGWGRRNHTSGANWSSSGVGEQLSISWNSSEQRWFFGGPLQNNLRVLRPLAPLSFIF